jgi:membrane associated rhomboid family serine protease
MSRCFPGPSSAGLPLGFYLEFVRVPAFLLIGLWVLLQLLFSYIGPSYGAYVWWAHIGGFHVRRGIRAVFA